VWPADSGRLKVNNILWEEHVQIRGVHPLYIIRDLILDVESIQYVKILIVGSLEANDARSPKWPLDEEEGEIAGTDLVDITEGPGGRLFAKGLAVQRTLYPRRHREPDYDSEVYAQSCHDIASGDIQEVASLLVTMLSSLQSVQISSRVSISTDSRFWIKLYPAIEHSHHLGTFNSSRNLSDIRLRAERDSLGAIYGICEAFMALPSVHQIKGYMLDGRSDGRLASFEFQDLRSDESEFQYSSIPAYTFRRIISCTTTLTRFVNDSWKNDHHEEYVLWEPASIVAALREHASHSLIHLQLTGQFD